MSQDSMCHAREMSALALMVTLPQELQNRIFQLSEIDELLVLCRLNTFWYRKTIPWIWEDIDFVTDVDEYFAVDRSRSFFALCDKLIDEQPGRWAIMAASVRKLNLGRLHGINIVYEEWTGDEYPFFIEGEKNDASGRNVFSIIAEFTNLNKLSVYVKNHWEWVGCSNAKKALSKGLQNLKSLKIGGQIPEGIIDGLLHKPEIIEDLAIINLHDTPGQDDGPNGRTFLSMEDESRFTSLKTLHLCKLADLDGRSLAEWDDNDDGQEFVSGMVSFLLHQALYNLEGPESKSCIGSFTLFEGLNKFWSFGRFKSRTDIMGSDGSSLAKQTLLYSKNGPHYSITLQTHWKK